MYQPTTKGGNTMQFRENRIRNFVVIQSFGTEDAASRSVLDVRFEPNFNIVRQAIAHVGETDSRNPIVYLTPRKPYNRNAYVVVLGNRTGSKPLYLRFTLPPEGVEAYPSSLFLAEQNVEQAFAQLLYGEKVDGTHSFGVPAGFGLPALLAIQVVLGDDHFKFMIGVADQDSSVDPRPFNKLGHHLVRPPGKIKKRWKLAKVIKMTSTKE
jgi:hypothetical protein